MPKEKRVKYVSPSSSVCEYCTLCSTVYIVHTQDSWSKIFLWDLKYVALCLMFICQKNTSFIYLESLEELVIPCLLSSLTVLIVALLSVVQCQAFCIYSYCFSCDATAGAVSWGKGHCSNRCEVVAAFLALSTWTVEASFFSSALQWGS